MAMNNDSRSADPLGHTIFSMASDTNVRAYSSWGGSEMVVNNSGSNGAVGMGVQGGGGIKNASAAASDQMGVSNSSNNNGIPSKVVRECKGYTMPESCHGNSGGSDEKIRGSANSGVATGPLLDPNFRNSNVTAQTDMKGGIVSTSLKVSGDVDDETIGSAVCQSLDPSPELAIAIRARRVAIHAGAHARDRPANCPQNWGRTRCRYCYSYDETSLHRAGRRRTGDRCLLVDAIACSRC